MSHPDPEVRRVRCHHCNNIIGVYEPMMLETHHGPRETSLAAEPELYEAEDPRFHRSCYVLAAETEP